MKINPINIQNNTNFQAKIVKNNSLDSAYSIIAKNASSAQIKNMNFAKDFVDSMRKIATSKKIEEFNIYIDKRRPNYTYVNINGRRVSGGANEYSQCVEDNYRIIECCKKYASKLKEETISTKLDEIKSEVEAAEKKLHDLKEKYSKMLKQELTEQQFDMLNK